MKLKFEEAISVPEYERRSIADTIDYHTVGMFHFIFTAFRYSIIRNSQMYLFPEQLIFSGKLLIFIVRYLSLILFV